MEYLKEKVKSVSTIYCNHQDKHGFTFAMSDETARKWQKAGLKVFKADVSFEELPLDLPEEVLQYVDIIKAQLMEELIAELPISNSKSKSSSRKKLDKNSPQYKAWTAEAWEVLAAFEETGEKFTLHDVSEIVSVPKEENFVRSISKTKEFMSRFRSLEAREKTTSGHFTYYVANKHSSGIR